MSNVKAMPLADNATVEQLLIRAADRNRDEKWKNAMVIWTSEDGEVHYLASKQVQMETLFCLELIKLDLLGVPRT